MGCVCCHCCGGPFEEDKEKEEEETPAADHPLPDPANPIKMSNLLSAPNISFIEMSDAFNKPSNVKTNIESLDLTTVSTKGVVSPRSSKPSPRHHHRSPWGFPAWLWSHHHKHSHDTHKYSNAADVLSPILRGKQNNNKDYMGSFLFTNVLAMNALDLTAPASDALLKNRKNAWVQLAGHPGSFAPAGPHTIWKKRMTKENNETVAYQALLRDSVKDMVPVFYREVHFNGDVFIEIEDLLHHFTNPSIMDIKMGTRTFLESEVTNPVVRKDLYEKMVKLDMNEPTEEEHEEKAITKLRYMQFREKDSSTATLGFRVEALRMAGESPNCDLKKIKTREQVKKSMSVFLEGSLEVMNKILHRLEMIKEKFAESEFFRNHEIIGSSLLILYDHHHHANVWLIDFAKTLPVECSTLTHCTAWEVGNHEDGYLIGLENIIALIQEIIAELPTSSDDVFSSKDKQSPKKTRLKEET